MPRVIGMLPAVAAQMQRRAVVSATGAYIGAPVQEEHADFKAAFAGRKMEKAISRMFMDGPVDALRVFGQTLAQLADSTPRTILFIWQELRSEFGAAYLRSNRG
jgi:hypothetical protein